jgi:uncharacterized SAM-binding protein YcdF (DUF218 family)
MRRFAAGLAMGGLAARLVVELGLPGLFSYAGDSGPLIVAMALVAGALFTTRLRPLVVLSTAAVAALWLAVAFTPLSRWLGEGLVRRDTLRPADAILVLGSRLQTDGEPTAPAMSRLFHGLELLADGHASRLIVTELPPPEPSYAAVARAWMRTLKLEGELIDLGPVRDTHDEAVATARLFRTRGYRTLLLITSPTHSSRAAACLEHEGIDVVSSPSIETTFDAETLDTSRARLDAFASILHERLGAWVYARRGWVTSR